LTLLWGGLALHLDYNRTETVACLLRQHKGGMWQ
jgi:hypothetical protein